MSGGLVFGAVLPPVFRVLRFSIDISFLKLSSFNVFSWMAGHHVYFEFFLRYLGRRIPYGSDLMWCRDLHLGPVCSLTTDLRNYVIGSLHEFDCCLTYECCVGNE